MLARLDSLPGVRTARTDSSGRFFWLSLGPGADPSLVATAAGTVLGSGARPLPEPEAEAQLRARGTGDPWFDAGEVMSLSFIESRLLSVRFAGEASRRFRLLPEQRERVAEALRTELFAAMERVHREGGRESSGWIYEEWPALAAAAAARCAPHLPPEVVPELGALLPTLLAR